MKKYHAVIITLAFSFWVVSCAHYPPDRYNTQVGAGVGAGMGALMGQAIGGNTESTLIGMATGTFLGFLSGNAADQEYQAAREAAQFYGPPPPPVRYYRDPPPPPAYYYGWWAWPIIPSLSFYFSQPHHHGYYRHRPYSHYRGRRNHR